MHKVRISIENLKQCLPHGAIKEIAARSNKNYDTVRRVLNGQSLNSDVMIAIEGYVLEIKNRKESIDSCLLTLSK